MEIKKKLKKNIFQLKSKAKCPTCKKKQKEPFVPFCSKKCAELDLMKWLSDEHQMHMKNN
ncbi:MAG: DNA gyrase inhibitor YacG [Alphaproteobacteria bacterium MarineAlpha5_Bin5]|nr:MAG: DNA gyrase inhibitor YacG [Alphaproteobacteria bacterium MarineAlpha5_Bin5]PPR51936.1 MAG: DNA gyrase inhibitor YacG [Alphaproteobacteria bacterium MarineAlpha5_Bin4]|tara:strand:- start:20244 stop:20423 length:180 start_codon:yes stop_codon:yes gene_type:complete